MFQSSKTLAWGIVSLVTLCMATAAKSEEQAKFKGEATVIINDDGLAVIELIGTSSELGRCEGYGELVFLPGQEEGSLEGFGVVAFTAANGDVLAGVMNWSSSGEGAGTSQFHWLDEVTFSDGTVVESTGRFEHHRPPGLTITFQILDGETGEVVFELIIRF